MMNGPAVAVTSPPPHTLLPVPTCPGELTLTQVYDASHMFTAVRTFSEASVTKGTSQPEVKILSSLLP